ncbi:Rieske (2Fe-2S) protein [Halomarina pelagica]|uniref:Rieske (2Fe-2S) protein n=1 Tax=Halomarina pelagica TaxID=2961599 RepID=UPI0020C28F43|nr:Rieske 2Fe-2S domain-containing protein [Halomarina sp. BND7]
MDEDRRIASVEEVPEDGTLLFTVRDGFDTEEVVLIRLATEDDEGATGGDASVAAWKNYCQHWTDVRLDKGSGAMVRDGEIVCQRHGATFERDSGYCTFGPCEGAYLEEVAVAVEDGAVYLADDRYEFANLGPSGEHDLSTGSRIDFSGT